MRSHAKFKLTHYPGVGGLRHGSEERRQEGRRRSKDTVYAVYPVYIVYRIGSRGGGPWAGS